MGTYIKDEGTILRRLLGAFSMRPTIVVTTPLYNVMSPNSFVSPNNISKVTTIPMITIRLPLNTQGSDLAIHLSHARNQAQWYIENKTFVPKSQSILFTRDILFFYVARRYQTINVGR